MAGSGDGGGADSCAESDVAEVGGMGGDSPVRAGVGDCGVRVGRGAGLYVRFDCGQIPLMNEPPLQTAEENRGACKVSEEHGNHTDAKDLAIKFEECGTDGGIKAANAGHDVVMALVAGSDLRVRPSRALLAAKRSPTQSRRSDGRP